MRSSQWFYATLKELPNEAEIVSHQLMLRAGLIRKLGSGLYTWLPTGLKVLKKIEAIVREEMNAARALEVLMPAVQPKEIWEMTGRWENFGGQLLKMQDSNGRFYCFGPTHEEVITTLMQDELQSYKQLPVNFYQIQTKFRDEIRPRFGVMRAREFIMKDAYSFHLTEKCLEQTYQAMYDAYCKIFTRMGLKYRAVEADTGAIGGAVSHEFQVLAESGEDVIFYSDSSNYAANIEQATSLKPNIDLKTTGASLEKILTKHKKTIDEVATFLNVDPAITVKTLIVKGTTAPLVALILQGNDELNLVKAQKHPLVKSPLEFASQDEISTSLKLDLGYIGPINLDIPIVVDHNAYALNGFICGANEKDYHYQNALWLRDTNITESFDLRTVKIGDPSPDHKGTLQTCRGIEVGHVFQLGTKYAEALNAQVLNEHGKLQTMLMGCYGLGISRVVAAAIEQNHDERGIIWPVAIAPFQLVIIPINASRVQEVKELSLKLYRVCQKLNIDVLLDDRAERVGVLFADNDLIGIPHRLVISEKNLTQGLIEYKKRDNENPILINLSDFETFLMSEIVCL